MCCCLNCKYNEHFPLPQEYESKLAQQALIYDLLCHISFFLDFYINPILNFGTVFVSHTSNS